ncbi:MAG: alpha-1,4-glucan--maltose-1-phosphate maltosyltransferase [Nakamurella sp.]
MAGRIGIADISPRVACGAYPAKAVVDERIRIQATVFREGHDAVAANVVWKHTDDEEPTGATSAPLIRMDLYSPGLDLWEAHVVPDRMGDWTFTVQAWSDPLATWKHNAEVKAHAGQSADEMANDLEIGAALLEQFAARPDQPYVGAIRAAVEALRDGNRSVVERIGPALAPELWKVLEADPIRELVTSDGPHAVWVDRKLGAFSAWYEFFPRSQGAVVDEDGAVVKHGTFRDAIGSLPRVARMGFDILYMPPIHPIGRLNRKGPNNTVHSEPHDVGSPWAIGSAEGGHDAIHPELGTIEDFDAFVTAANELGLEVGLDLALQAAPDHPWVATNPEWFTTRPDGTIAYAENPPKKYQDIYPINFDNAPETLYAEVLRIVQYWIAHGVTVFRVDNPHTKPVDFWEWLIAEVHKTAPAAMFLAEAFTRPAMMHELARAGFTQSYTYFTWRNAKQEITDYCVELVDASDYMRPSFWVNTPDILPFALQRRDPATFALRAVLAATLSPTWGVYAGFELFEYEVLAPGREEYLNSEKFQIRPRDFETALATGQSLEPLLGALNRIRKAHPALQRMKGLWFHGIDNDNLLVYSRHDEFTGDTVLVVVALNTDGSHFGTTDLWLPALGLSWGDEFDVFDELSGAAYRWGQSNAVILNPALSVAHIFTVKHR